MRSENNEGQFLRVDAVFFDNSRDWEETTIGAIGDFIPSEVEEEFRERLERTLRRRHAARLAEAAKPAADAPGTIERKSP
jgi:hypothetical protein